jgi:tRNA-dihydrouridine synthase A
MNFEKAEAPVNPSHSRPELSRRFSVAPMMDWTYYLRRALK